MSNPHRPHKKGYLSSLGERFFSVLQSCIKPEHKINRNRKAGTVDRFQRPLKLKRLFRTVKIFLVALVLIGCATWFSLEVLSDSDIFRIASVKVQGNRMVSDQQVLEKSGLARGRSMLNFDVQQMAENIKSLDWVNEVMIKRQWPSTVRVTVREHSALALVNLAGEEKKKLYYIDTNGHVFAPVQSSTDLDFPVLSGRNLPEHLEQMRVKKESIAGGGLEFLRLAAKNNQILPLQAVSEVQVSDEKGLIVYLVDYPFPIYLGNEKIRERYYLLVRVLTQLYRNDKIKEVKEIRMDYAENKIMVARLGSS